MHNMLAQIIELVSQEIACYRQLLELVENERLALLARRHQDLFSLSEKKLSHIQRLGAVQERRRELMRRVGTPQQPVTKLIDLAPMVPEPQREAFRTAVHQAANLAQHLVQQNQANRTYVEEALDTVEHVLSIMHGQTQKVSYGKGFSAYATNRPRFMAREV